MPSKAANANIFCSTSMHMPETPICRRGSDGLIGGRVGLEITTWSCDHATGMVRGV